MSEDKLKQHREFRGRKEMKRPLVSFHPGEDFFFSRHYRVASHPLETRRKITI